ncbi:MAG: glycosyltransferase family 2 protein [Prevotella sp.]|nr:glycosyltransferase family 2 protein [Prevotella sp.]
METDLVTIVIPVFERVDFFEEALKSALNQTTQCHIVVSDNGSSHDNFKIICDKYPKRVEYHKNTANIGMFPNWNRCVNYVNTPYVMILGDDDILSPDFIEKFLGVKTNLPSLDLFYSNYSILYEPNKIIENNPLPNYWGLGTMKDIKYYAIIHFLGFPSVSCVCRTELYKQYPFEERIHGCNDWLSIYSFNNDIQTFGLNEKLCKYRKHSKSDTKRSEMRLIMALNHFLILSKLSLQEDVSYLVKMKWIGLLHLCCITHKKFVYKYLEKDSGYKNIYSLLKTKYTFLYNLSVVLGAYHMAKSRMGLKLWE